MNLFLHLSVVCESVCLLSIRQSCYLLCQYIYVRVCLFVSMSVRVCVCVCLYVCLSVSVQIYIVLLSDLCGVSIVRFMWCVNCPIYVFCLLSDLSGLSTV